MAFDELMMVVEALLPSSKGSRNGLAESRGIAHRGMGSATLRQSVPPGAEGKSHCTKHCSEMVHRTKYGTPNYKDSRGNIAIYLSDTPFMTLSKQKFIK